jgi:hypothetical protein
MQYYHITSFKGWQAINKEGIKCDVEGYIYVLDSLEVASYVALNQLGHADYGLFKIDPAGIYAPLETNDVAELTSKHQFRFKQSLLERQYLTDSGMHKIQ